MSGVVLKSNSPEAGRAGALILPIRVGASGQDNKLHSHPSDCWHAPLQASLEPPPCPSFKAHCKCLRGHEAFSKDDPQRKWYSSSSEFLCFFVKAYHLACIRFSCSCHSQSSSRYKNNKNYHSLNTFCSFTQQMITEHYNGRHLKPTLPFVAVTSASRRHRHNHFAVKLGEVKEHWDHPASQGKSQAATLGQTDCKSCTLPTGPLHFLR